MSLWKFEGMLKGRFALLNLWYLQGWEVGKYTVNGLKQGWLETLMYNVIICRGTTELGDNCL